MVQVGGVVARYSATACVAGVAEPWAGAITVAKALELTCHEVCWVQKRGWVYQVGVEWQSSYICIVIRQQFIYSICIVIIVVNVVAVVIGPIVFVEFIAVVHAIWVVIWNKTKISYLKGT